MFPKNLHANIYSVMPRMLRADEKTGASQQGGQICTRQVELSRNVTDAEILGPKPARMPAGESGIPSTSLVPVKH
jgi:hypothetical protein